MLEYGPDGLWLDQLAAAELPPPPAGTPTWPADPGRIVLVAVRDGSTARGKPIAWARCGRGWACLLIWPSARRHVLGRRRHARWGWYVYDPAVVRAEPDIYAGKPGASFGARFLPGFDKALAEARAALAGLSGPQGNAGPGGRAPSARLPSGAPGLRPRAVPGFFFHDPRYFRRSIFAKNTGIINWV